jgi:hypothetical protein
MFAHSAQTFRDMATSAQAAAAAAVLETKQESEARQQLAQLLELKVVQIASLMSEGALLLRLRCGHRLR